VIAPRHAPLAGRVPGRERRTITPWSLQFRQLRRNRGLSPADLSSLSGTSQGSIASYELGRRRPTRAHLSRLLECLDADEPSRNAIFAAAGFAPDFEVGRYAERGLTTREARSVVRERPWPSLLVSAADVIAANAAASRLLGLPLDSSRARRSKTLTAATRRAVGRSCDNWDELVAGTIGAFKAAQPGEASLDVPSPAHAALFHEYCAEDPVLLERFARLWVSTPPFKPTYAGRTYSVTWRTGARSRIHFEAIISCVNTVTGLYVHSWIPVDAQSHHLLERLLAGRR
jgi:transcriptional regulator with XRE-family HTH domain